MTENDVIKLPTPEIVLNKTKTNTIKKFNYTYSKLMYERSPVELLDNIFMGDIAKNSLFHYLNTNCKKKVIDYDEIRTDNFMKPDPGWDFKVGDKMIKAEVKSSIPPNNESYQSIINKRDIKITASHNNGKDFINPTNLESQIHVQIYFYAKIYKRGYNSFEKLNSDLMENPNLIHEIINTTKYSSPLFFGWESKQKIINYSKTLKPPTWTFSWTNRLYWRCPIKFARNLTELVKIIDLN